MNEDWRSKSLDELSLLLKDAKKGEKYYKELHDIFMEKIKIINDEKGDDYVQELNFKDFQIQIINTMQLDKNVKLAFIESILTEEQKKIIYKYEKEIGFKRPIKKRVIVYKSKEFSQIDNLI